MSKVYLVGAGPGDPELITVKGRRLLERADAVLYDHLANPALLDLAPSGAERVYVGKKRAEHAFTQAEIISMMVERARRGMNVVRLKGGDPFIFGRGGEEVEGLALAGVAFEVVPGVTSPLGIAAYTGVPLTHREHTSTVTFVTGHDMAAVNWSNVAGSETLVIFMGLHHLAEITARLIEAGRNPETPAIAVQWGTRACQRTVQGSLREISGLVEAAKLNPPATVIVGDVASLRNQLSWFEKLPLFGKQVVVTRARAQAGELVQQLREAGAEVVLLPVIEMSPAPDSTDLDSCIGRIGEYDWIVFTSVNAVEFFIAKVADLRKIRAKICAVGPATAEALEQVRLGVDMVPEQHTADGVAAAFASEDVKGSRVLFPRAGGARDVVPASLQALGAIVDSPETYRNIFPAEAEARVRDYFAAGRCPDWVTFTSPSTVNNFLEAADRKALERARIATIGPATSEAVRKHGLHVHVEAASPSVEELAAAITRYNL
jgi:uroporphyrinogen III methyltransferase / synthase